MDLAFPFSAIVGQETLKHALLLGVIQPRLGGVLIRGTKGVAKSTAVRALAALLPGIETVAGCPFQRWPGESIPDWPLPPETSLIVRPVPLVELPLGATEDRVLGSLHLEKALRGERAFEPGLLAAANRGILFIDEVNLLADHMVDILLDAASAGVHRLEREGLSLTHPSRFVLVGTMNPEEGELRPQLLDRFGLAVDVADLTDAALRTEAIRRRLAFERDQQAFTRAWKDADAAEADRLIQARRLLPQVEIDDALLFQLSERCLAEGVEGLRADLTLSQAACAWAAYQGRRTVVPDDVDQVAELALAHRRTRPPTSPVGGGGPGNGSHSTNGGQNNQEPKSQKTGPTPGSASPNSSSLLPSPPTLFPSEGLYAPRPKPVSKGQARSVMPGRWRKGACVSRGIQRGPVTINVGNGHAIAWSSTLRAAAPLQMERGRTEAGQALVIRPNELRKWPPKSPAGFLILFLIDASGSMASWQRMRKTKAAVLSLLVQGYQHRDQVALLTFRGQGADVILPPTRGLSIPQRILEAFTVGGTTPLAQGLAKARRFISDQIRKQPDQLIWTVLLTDGRGNVPFTPAGDPWQDVLEQARALARLGTNCLVVDTETGRPRFGLARKLAQVLGASFSFLEDVLGRPLPDHWRQAI